MYQNGLHQENLISADLVELTQLLCDDESSERKWLAKLKTYCQSSNGASGYSMYGDQASRFLGLDNSSAQSQASNRRVSESCLSAQVGPGEALSGQEDAETAFSYDSVSDRVERVMSLRVGPAPGFGTIKQE